MTVRHPSILLLFVCLSLFPAGLVQGQGESQSDRDVRAAIRARFDSLLTPLSEAFDPFYFIQDFTGDGAPDLAVLVNPAEELTETRDSLRGCAFVSPWFVSVGGEMSDRDDPFTSINNETTPLILILHARPGGIWKDARECFVLLATMADTWEVYKGKVNQGVTDKPPPLLAGAAILTEKLESASGIIYWDGATYRWYQQGD